MYTSIWWYLRVLPVLHRPEVVDIGVNTIIEKHTICLKNYRIRSFLSIHYVHGDLCKHLGIDSSTDHPDRYSNLFLNAFLFFLFSFFCLSVNLSSNSDNFCRF